MNIFKSILAWIAGLFGSKNPQPHEVAVKPSVAEKKLDGHVNAIALHPDLVKNLKGDHQELLGLYTAFVTDAKEQKYDVIVEKLKHFKKEFGAHLNTENTKFYGYLEQQLQVNSQEHKEMRAFRNNMRKIEKSVNQYLDNWIANGVNNSTVLDFQKESDEIATALVQRIQSEEQTLYPIYELQIEEFSKTA